MRQSPKMRGRRHNDDYWALYWRSMRLGPFAALIVSLLVPAASLAQSLGVPGGGGPSFIISVDPQYPAPHSQAMLKVESDSLDLTNATLSASVAGKNIYQGNVQPVLVTVGRAGSVTRVDLSLSSGGTKYNQTVSIQPQDVSLVVEPVSSAPPLYLGKPLVPMGGGVRVAAVANMRNVGGTALNPTALSYVWTVDDTRVLNSSGIGKSTLVVASPLPYRTRTVSVAITSQDGSLVGGDSVSFSPREPSVRIYENDSLLGIRFDRALPGAYSIVGAEATLYAAPFGIATTLSAPLIEWFLNGSRAQTGSSITLRPTGDGAGGASLSLTASDGGNTTASANLRLSFGEGGGTNFLGL